jgi:hypothetical protein
MNQAQSTANFSSMNEDVFREVMKYLSKKEVGRIRQVNKQCYFFAGAHLLSEVMRAKKLLNEEWQILRKTLPPLSDLSTGYHFYITHRFIFMRDGIKHLVDTYKKYVGKDIYPAIPAQVCIQIPLICNHFL